MTQTTLSQTGTTTAAEVEATEKAADGDWKKVQRGQTTTSLPSPQQHEVPQPKQKTTITSGTALGGATVTETVTTRTKEAARKRK